MYNIKELKLAAKGPKGCMYVIEQIRSNMFTFLLETLYITLHASQALKKKKTHNMEERVSKALRQIWDVKTEHFSFT